MSELQIEDLTVGEGAEAGAGEGAEIVVDAKDAEIEALKAEVEKLKAELKALKK